MPLLQLIAALFVFVGILAGCVTALLLVTPIVRKVRYLPNLLHTQSHMWESMSLEYRGLYFNKAATF